MTTNGTQLAALRTSALRCGIRRVNVSLDSRDPERFRHITRRGELGRCWRDRGRGEPPGSGSRSTWWRSKGLNEDEIAPMLRWCAGEGHDLTLIETMPLGEVEEDRTAHYLPLDDVRHGWSASSFIPRSPGRVARRAISRSMGLASARLHHAAH